VPPPPPRDATAWLDAFWDERAGLVRYPGRIGSPTNPYQAPGVHLVRESAMHAVALLARGAPGDASRAGRTLERVLEHQIDAEGSVAHGTWRRTPDEPPPGPSPREWIDYDPNWREFIGTALALALSWDAALPPGLVRRIEAALRRACVGTLARAVPAEYTNIALMSAFLLDWTGDRLGEPAWRGTGLGLARAVVAAWDAAGAFPEYGSPTYYGIDLYGLALWRERAPAPELREWGARVEAELWRDLARFYHAGLRNLCGPYTRAYGMDMTTYVASLGCWIAPHVAEASAPLPPLGDAVPHAHDLFELPMVALLGSRPPPDVKPALARFQAPRAVEQRITRSPRRVATARLRDGAMWGGEQTGGQIVHWQHHPATVHWREPDGRVGWLRVRSNAPVDAVADDAGLRIAVQAGLPWLRESEVWLELATRPDAGARRDGRRLVWEGMAIGLRDAPTLGEEQGGAEQRWVHRAPPGAAPDRLELALEVAA